MVVCKRCDSKEYVKNGVVHGKQRYRCTSCSYNFTEGDGRSHPSLAAKKALAVLLYSLGKGSFSMLGKIFGHSPSLIYRWINEAAAQMPEPEIAEDIREIECDEMWHFLEKKVKNSGSSKQWIVAHGELSHGLRVVVMLRPSSDSTIKSST
jgi:transposase-like protein